MRMGTVAELAQDDSVALRVRFIDRVPPPSTLYFRGPVLTRFDGEDWRPTPPAFVRTAADLDVHVSGEPVRYEMTLEPSKLPLLPLLEVTPVAPAIENHRVLLRDTLQWGTERPLVERLRFQATAYPQFGYGADTFDASLTTANVKHGLSKKAAAADAATQIKDYYTERLENYKIEIQPLPDEKPK
jgi:hypothetical protein